MIKCVKDKVQASGSMPTYTGESAAVVAGIYKKLKEEAPSAVDAYLISMYRMILGLMDNELKDQKREHDARMAEIIARRKAEREKRKEALEKNGGSKSENVGSTDGETDSSSESAEK